jgi:hypothetical protein
MFSLRIIGSAKFLKMPVSVRELYFQLGMKADDDGIVEAYSVMKAVGSTEDDIKVLSAKNFIKILNEDLVSYVMDWTEHNLIRADRKINSIYKDLLLQIVPECQLLEQKPRADTGKVTGRPMDNQRTAQVRIGKVSLGKDSIDIEKDDNSNPPTNSPLKEKIFLRVNVKMTQDEYSKLVVKFPDIEAKLDTLSEYKYSKGVKYASDYHTILSWARKDDKKTKPQTQYPDLAKMGDEY